ncbi:hypothetical protein WJX84_004909 [Apatococcus fuscideae]|uniref:APAF-1 helical domain-containing protein n=1 Tax=Apatococcus fuscideae TaxID=2026836 RepID=A0AAW1TH49_9CHLO
MQNQVLLMTRAVWQGPFSLAVALHVRYGILQLQIIAKATTNSSKQQVASWFELSAKLKAMSGQPVYADLKNHDGGGLWQQAGGVTFVIYMVIGFSATMGLIVAVVGSLMFIRRCCYQRQQAPQQLPRARPAGGDSLPMVNSEPAFLVVNPGGMHNIAFQEHETIHIPDCRQSGLSAYWDDAFPVVEDADARIKDLSEDSSRMVQSLSLGSFQGSDQSSRPSQQHRKMDTDGQFSEEGSQGGSPRSRLSHFEHSTSRRRSSISGFAPSIAETGGTASTSPMPGTHDRTSLNSEGHASTTSGRSSFAMERGSLDTTSSGGLPHDGGRSDGPGWSPSNSVKFKAVDKTGSVNSDLDRFWQSSKDGGIESPADPDIQLARLCHSKRVPKALRGCMASLAVLPPDVPLPISMLARLWGTEVPCAEATARALEVLSCIRLASLQDGSTWALLTASQSQELLACGLPTEDMHDRLMQDYLQGHEDPLSVPDDGYFMLHVGHHMIGAQRLSQLRDLLCSSAWLQTKMAHYGAPTVVADFRRFLLVDAEGSRKLAGPKQQQVKALRPLTASLEQAGGLHRLTLRGHNAAITAVHLLPDGVHALSASENGSSRLWDLETGTCQHSMGEHKGKVTAMDVGMEGGLLVTGSCDMTARVWDLRRGHCLACLKGHTAEVLDVAVDSRGRFCATASGDGTCRLWSLSNGKCAHILRSSLASGLHAGKVFAVALTPDSTKAVTASDDFLARVWDISNGRCKWVLSGHTNWVTALDIRPDGRAVVTASHDCTARVWDLQLGTCLGELSGHAGRVNAAWWSSEGSNAVITASDDNTARVWDCADFCCRHVLEGHGGWVSAGASCLSPSMMVTAGGDNLSVVWNTETGACVNVLQGHSAPVTCVTLTRKGRFAVTGSEDCTVRVWDLQSGSTHFSPRHQGSVHTLLSTSDGRLAASLGKDGQALVWEAATGDLVHSFEDSMNWGCITSPGDCLLACSGNRCIRSWDLHSGACNDLMPVVPGSRVKCCALSASGTLALVVLFDSRMTVWDLAGQCPLHVLQRKGDREHSRAHSAGINAASISPTERHAVSVGKDGTARIWDLSTGTCLHILDLHKEGVEWAEFNPSGDQLLTLDRSSKPCLWEVESGQCRGALLHPHSIAHACYSPDGARLLASMHSCHELICWHAASLTAIATLKGHTGTVRQIAFHFDGQLALSCSEDCSLRLWHVSSGSCVGLFAADDPLVCCAFVGPRDSQTLMAGSEGGAVHFVQMPPATAAATATPTTETPDGNELKSWLKQDL